MSDKRTPEEKIADQIFHSCVLDQCDGMWFDRVKAGKIIRDQITALTQRAEKAERERDEREQECVNWESLCGTQILALRALDESLTAAESELKRLQEGIEELKYDIHTPIDLYERIGPTWTSRDTGQEYYDASYVLDKMAELEASVDAMLSQPSDAKEATNAQ